MNLSAWVVLIIISLILYGGSLRHILIALKLRPKDIICSLTVDNLRNHWASGLKQKLQLLASLFVLLILIGMIVSFSMEDIGKFVPGSPEREKERRVLSSSMETRGYLGEGESKDIDLEFVNRTVVNATFWLNWTDDDTQEIGAGVILGSENQPDGFTLRIRTPEGEEKAETGYNDLDTGEGSLVIRISIGGGEMEEDWELTIKCVEAGDSVGQLSGLTTAEDQGNDWELCVSYEYVEYV